MNKGFISEFAEKAKNALALANREASHLRYTVDTIYEDTIDLEWVEQLSSREDLAEKLDAFVGRFGRLQDHLGEKLLPTFASLLGAQPRSLIDVLAFAE